MNKFPLLASLVLSACIAPAAQPPEAATGSASGGPVVEAWKPEGYLGTSKDEKGSTILTEFVEGPSKGESALLLTYKKVPEGWVGANRNLDAKLAGAKAVTFMAKMDPPGSAEIVLSDANKVIYTAAFEVQKKEWTKVEVPLEAFQKSPYYQPPEAIQGKPKDFTKATQIMLNATQVGEGKIWMGPVYAKQ